MQKYNVQKYNVQKYKESLRFFIRAIEAVVADCMFCWCLAAENAQPLDMNVGESGLDRRQ